MTRTVRTFTIAGLVGNSPDIAGLGPTQSGEQPPLSRCWVALSSARWSRSTHPPHRRSVPPPPSSPPSLKLQADSAGQVDVADEGGRRGSGPRRIWRLWAPVRQTGVSPLLEGLAGDCWSFVRRGASRRRRGRAAPGTSLWEGLRAVPATSPVTHRTGRSLRSSPRVDARKRRVPIRQAGGDGDDRRSLRTTPRLTGPARQNGTSAAAVRS